MITGRIRGAFRLSRILSISQCPWCYRRLVSAEVCNRAGIRKCSVQLHVRCSIVMSWGAVNIHHDHFVQTARPTGCRHIGMIQVSSGEERCGNSWRTESGASTIPWNALNSRKLKKWLLRLQKSPDATEGPDPSSVGSTSTNHLCRTNALDAEDACPPTRPPQSYSLISAR